MAAESLYRLRAFAAEESLYRLRAFAAEDLSSTYVVPPEKVQFYRQHGWVVLEDVVPPSEVARIRGVADAMLQGEIPTRRNLADLGGFLDRVRPEVQNIIQIAWPTDLASQLDENLLISRGRAISDQLYGDVPGTWCLDMNQFLIKATETLTDTPLHQDQSYYIKLRDSRACNIWLALCDVSDDMGCLWFEDAPLDAPIPLRVHRAAGRGGGALECGNGPELEKMTCCPLRAGSITVHSHLTPHYAKGNKTSVQRYGYVVQTRPAASVREARIAGFDHGRTANVARAPNNAGAEEGSAK